MNNILGVFAKYPEPGRVKTRLARDIGDAGAMRVYKTIAERVLRKTAPDKGDYGRIVFYSPSSMKGRFGEWLPGERLLPQRGRDIGERMKNALMDLFTLRAEKAAVIGVDLPDLNRDIIQQSFLELDSSDVVIGPALDGGYYLIGMKMLFHELFRGIPWSSDKVFEETIETIHKLELNYSVLDRLSDVDTVEDLRKFIFLHHDLT
jgi:uncharacterized protein